MTTFLSRFDTNGWSLGVSYRCGIWLLPLLVLLPDVCLAGDPIPGEERAGIIYTLTHLHPITYLILFAVFVLSVLNLVYGGRLRTHRRLQRTGRNRAGKRRGRETRADQWGGAPVVDEMWRGVSDEPLQEGLVNGPRPVRKAPLTAPAQPTPLDGVDHPLPDMLSGGDSQSGAPRMVAGKPQSSASTTPFKFTSAVELPSQEEIERRDRKKVVVTGTVKGIDGKGLGSVLVYLTNDKGNRIGQSCRSVPDTGEFKVLVNEPGQYSLVGYKRGFIMEHPETAALPIESGKIEGYMFRMIPEGCLVHGRLIRDPGADTRPELEIRCVRPDDGFVRTATVESTGAFRISGVPHDSTCHLEVLSPEGEILTVSDPFQTERLRDVFRNITLSSNEVVEAFHEDQAGPPEMVAQEQIPEEDIPQPPSPTPADQA